MPDCGHGWRHEVDCATCRPPRAAVEGMRSYIAELEAHLAEYRALYRWFGQDGMTDGLFAAEFERVYLADNSNRK